MKLLLHMLPVYIFLFCSPAFPESRTITEFFKEASAAGHRDLHSEVRGDTLAVTFWPIGFRDDYAGFIDMKERIGRYSEKAHNNHLKNILLTQTSWGLPVIRAQFRKGESQQNSYIKRAFKHHTPVKNSKVFHLHRKVLIQFDFPLVMKFGDFNDPLVFRTGVRPDIRLNFRPGLILYGQVDLYVHNEFKPSMWYKPADIGCMLAHAVTDKIVSITNIGAFAYRDIYGIDEEILISFHNDELCFGLHTGIFGDLRFDNNHFYRADINRKMAIVSCSYSYLPFDCTFGVKGGRFLYGDTGFGVTLSRVFRELEIEFTGIRSGDEFVGKIQATVPLFPGHRKSFADHGLAHVRNVRLTYRYNSNTIIYNPEYLSRAVEPEVGISFREITGLARPVHYRFRSGNY